MECGVGVDHETAAAHTGFATDGRVCPGKVIRPTGFGVGKGFRMCHGIRGNHDCERRNRGTDRITRNVVRGRCPGSVAVLGYDRSGCRRSRRRLGSV